jgi:hypothetical protein
VKRTRCKAQTKTGVPCSAMPTAIGLCSIHSEPGRAAELGRMSGKSRRRPQTQIFVFPPPRTARDLHKALSQVFSDVGSGQMDVKLGKSLGYIASVLVKTIELSDHEVRLRAMEHILNSIRSGGTQE